MAYAFVLPALCKCAKDGAPFVLIVPASSKAGPPAQQDVDFTPYGNVADGTPTEHYLFTGQERDSESGLDFFNARHYTSALGRFMVPDPSGVDAADPANPQSWNLYAYVLNNPLRFMDPTGLDCVTVAKDIGTWNAEQGDCDPNSENAFYFDGHVDPNSVSIDNYGNVLASVDGKFQCSGDSNCAIYDNLTTVTVDSGSQIGTFFPEASPSNIMLTHVPFTTATISNVPNGKQIFCEQQSNKAALEDLLPGAMKGDYRPSGQGKIAEYAAHYALDAAAGSKGLQYAVRGATGVPKSVTAKLLGRASIALLLYSGYSALKAAQDEYKACLAD